MTGIFVDNIGLDFLILFTLGVISKIISDIIIYILGINRET